MNRCRWALVLIGLLIPLMVRGDVPYDEYLDEDSKPKRSVKRGDGEFYARVLHRDDLHDVNLYEVEVKVFPSTGKWPGVSLVNETVKELNIHTLIRIRGLSAPADHRSRLRPHVRVEQEREYFVDAMSFIWKLVSAHEYLILSNPMLVESPPGSGALVTEVDAFLEVGGIRVNLVDTIIFAGHADSSRGGGHDWGMRQVPEK